MRKLLILVFVGLIAAVTLAAEPGSPQGTSATIQNPMTVTANGFDGACGEGGCTCGATIVPILNPGFDPEAYSGSADLTILLGDPPEVGGLIPITIDGPGPSSGFGTDVDPLFVTGQLDPDTGAVTATNPGPYEYFFPAGVTFDGTVDFFSGTDFPEEFNGTWAIRGIPGPPPLIDYSGVCLFPEPPEPETQPGSIGVAAWDINGLNAPSVAEVSLYDNENCTGDPIPREAEKISDQYAAFLGVQRGSYFVKADTPSGKRLLSPPCQRVDVEDYSPAERDTDVDSSVPGTDRTDSALIYRLGEEGNDWERFGQANGFTEWERLNAPTKVGGVDVVNYSLSGSWSGSAVCGAPNDPGLVDISDSVWLLNSLPPSDGEYVEQSNENPGDLDPPVDSTLELNLEFLNGASPPAPFPECVTNGDSCVPNCPLLTEGSSLVSALSSPLHTETPLSLECKGADQIPPIGCPHFLTNGPVPLLNELGEEEATIEDFVWVPLPPGTKLVAFLFAPQLVQGDVDCKGSVNSVDNLILQRHVAGLSVSQNAGCPSVGSDVASLFGDVDCDGDVDAIDALKVLRFVVGLSVSQTEPCPDIGTALNVIEVAAGSGSPLNKAAPYAPALGLTFLGMGGLWGVSRRRGKR